MNVKLEKLLEEVEEANRVFVAIYDEQGLVVAYARVSKRAMKEAFSLTHNLSPVFKGTTHNQRKAKYHIEWNGGDLFIK